MTLDELKALKRGDVVVFFSRGRNPIQTEDEAIGLVVHANDLRGAEIVWEDGQKIGYYQTADDADKLTLISKAVMWYDKSPAFQKALAKCHAERATDE